MKTHFKKLNEGWNAEPNCPLPQVEVLGKDIQLTFNMNSFRYQEFKHGDKGKITFTNCFRFRLGSPNDEGWYRGQCRFSKIAPAWGEFYEVTGDLHLKECPNDWVEVEKESEGLSHFLFYFRDHTFECDAKGWQIQIVAGESI